MPDKILPLGPLYDPEVKVRKFRFGEDIESLRKTLLGTRDVWHDPKFAYGNLDADQEWRRPRDICNRPKFINGKPKRFDALQGKQGNCWLVNGIEAITLNNQLIKHVVPPDQSFDHNYIGAFHFRIWQLGTWYDVVVDDNLPVFKDNLKLVYVHSRRGDVFWGALLEKAYAKVCGHPLDLFTIDSLSDGNVMDALQDLSGGIVEMVLTRHPPVGTTLKWFMREVYLKNALMACKCYRDINEDTGLYSEHGYTITKVAKFLDNDPDYHGLFLVRIMNPWGEFEWKGDWSDNNSDKWNQIEREIRDNLNFVIRDDGEFWMDDTDFVKHFDTIFVCHLGPGQYINSQHEYSIIFDWKATALHGEWVKNISAGGAGLYTRHKNPQYKMQLELPKKKTYSQYPGLVNVVMELIHKSKIGRFTRLKPLAFYIYSLKNLNEPPMPLNTEFFQNNNPINDPDFAAGAGRAFVISIRLEPGSYIIVPCTLSENVEAQFLLRVCSQSPVDLLLVSHDTQISKTLPKEEQIQNESDEGLQRLFNDIAQGKNEIDWIGLKEILEAAMNTERSYYGMIALFFKYIRDSFEKYFSLSLSNEYKTDEVVFTKDECRSMIAMLDDDHSGKLSFSEFVNLWNKICFWTKVFEQHRDETEGHVMVGQLREALSSIGYNITIRTVHTLSYIYENERGSICLTDFILCGVTLETVLSLCQKEDVDGGNKTTLTLEEWVKNTLIL